ncbi:MAG: SpoIIIAH-like family protein [Bacillota bacterium]|nr:SpoIIIAH-like family protein [Bacillota bacterium]
MAEVHVRTIDRGAALRMAVFLLIVAGILAYIQWQWSQPRQVGRLVQSTAGERAGASEPALSPRAALPPAARGAGGQGGAASSGGSRSGSPGSPASSAQEAFWSDARLSRDRDRSRQIDLLQTLADDPNASAQGRDQARQELVALSQAATEESEAEALVKARGFRDALVYVFPRAAEVIVASERPLTRAQAAAIGDVVAQVTGLGYDRIRILTYPAPGAGS